MSWGSERLMEDYFKEFRENTIGYDYHYRTCYGLKRMIYADWTASGRLYKCIEDKLVNEFGPYIGNTHSTSSKSGMSMTISYSFALKSIKKHVNASKNDVIITSGFGTTSAINKLQRILGLKYINKNFLKAEGEDKPVVFVTHMEHNSNYVSWLETSSDVICLEPDSEGLVDLDNLRYLLKKYNNRKLKIGAFTACSNVTGIVTPYHKMASLMHEFGGYCFVDFASAAPYVAIDMNPQNPSEKLDAIYFSPHKFLGGPGTSGILIFDSNIYLNQVPDSPGGGTVNWVNPWGEKSYISDIELREDGGTPGFLQAIKTSLCIQLKNKMTVCKILERELYLMSILISEVKKIKNLHILADNITDRLGILSFYVDNIHYNLFVKMLSDRFGIQARGGCSCAGVYGHYLLNIDKDKSRRITDLIELGDLSKKPGWVRLSIHPIMTDEDIYYIATSIKETISHASEWSHDYKYNITTNEFMNTNLHDEIANVKKWFVL
jgi:selenocysteine lyase/cysteine desulfurase